MLKMHTVVEAMLDAEIQQIVALKQMAANPRLLDLMRRIVAASEGREGNAAVRDQQTLPGIVEEAAVQGASTPNGLTQATWEAVLAMGRPFTIPDIVHALNSTGFRFVAAKPKVAVAAPLKSFLKKGKLRLVSRGIGSEPNVYELANDSAGERKAS